MRAGRLKHRLNILESQPKYNWGGGGEPTWIIYKIVWGDIEPIRGKERYADDRIKSEITHIITIRFLKGITPSMRISFEDRIFDIKKILNLWEEERTLEIEAREVTGERES